MSKNLGKQVRSGFGWDLMGTFFKQISTLVVSVILARLLTPEQFGIVGMAMVFVSFSQVFIDVGFSQGLIQNEKNTQLGYSSVFYFNILLGALVGAIIFFSAPYIGEFYESEEVTNVTRLLFVIPIIGSFGNVQKAIFVRELSFKVLALRTVVSSVIGGLLGVTAALMDYGVYALVVQQISTVICFTLILWLKSDWKPSLSFSYKEIKALTNFSFWVFLDNLLRRFFSQLDTLFIGKYFSPASLGFYSRASSLNRQVEQYTTASLRNILFPAFSKIQNKPEAFKNSYYKVFRISSFLGALLAGSLFFLSEEIIIILLGDKWRPSIIIFQILVFKLILSPFGALIGKSLLAKGYSKQLFVLGQIRRVIFLTPIIFGYLYGLEVFALSIVLSRFIAFFINLVVVYKYLNFSIGKQLLIFFNPLTPLVVFVVPYLIFDLDINAYLILFIYLIALFSYTYITKDKGLDIFLDQVKVILKRTKKS